jgi:phosphate-selective porin OprO/OprP
MSARLVDPSHRNTNTRHRPSALIAALALSGVLAPAFPASAQDADTRALIADFAQRLQALEQRTTASAAPAGDAQTIADLQQRLALLERKLELQEEAETAKAQSAPVVNASADKGLGIKSADGQLEVKLRGLVQADGRFFLDDDQAPQNDGFLMRRIRPTLEGSWGPLLGFRLTPEFAGDSATIVDAYLDLKFDPRATVRIGKTKGPVGLERLQSGGALGFVERGFPTELAPNRDIGVQLQGALAGGTLNYVAGVYNGSVDGRDAATSNPDNELEYAARVFAEPWKNRANALSGLGFGIGASTGDTYGSGNNFLPRYRTPGQTQFFGYRGTVAADGRHARVSPQAYWYVGRFGTLAEWIASRQEVLAADGTREDLRHRAWQVTGGVVLTGEDASYRGVTKPNRPFSPGAGGWGAFELTARYGVLDVDDDAFPLFADPETSASRARAWTLGLNWYLTSNFKLVANYTQTAFDGGAPGGADREDERTFFTRAQFQF